MNFSSRISRARAILALLILGSFRLHAGAAAEGRGLQWRIDAAGEGDTVVVEGGTYEGDIVIRRTVHLVGVGAPVIRGTGKGSVVTILAPGCTVAGFVIEHCGPMLVGEDAGVLLKSDGNVIDGNELRDILFGVYLYQSDSNTIARNRISGRPWIDQGGRGSGIHIWNSNRNTIAGNTITQTRDGIYVQNANHMLIRENEISDVRYGLHYMYADTNTFIGNVFRDNVAGAAIMFTRNIVMRHNLFIRNRGFSSYGILLQDCHESLADSNIIADNVVGIFFENSTDNLFRDNVVARNDLSLEMFQNSVRNAFTGNAFIDNLNPLTIVGRRTESSWSVGGRGNYWSSYTGYDLDGDGIGDVPMKIENVFSYLEGKNANVRLYLYSPASQALAVSARAFPILDISGEVDEHPLMEPAPSGRTAGAAFSGAMVGRSGQRRSPSASTVPWAVPVFTCAMGYWAWRVTRRRRR